MNVMIVIEFSVGKLSSNCISENVLWWSGKCIPYHHHQL